MGHYSIWLEHYHNCRDKILEDLKSYKKGIDSLKEIIDKKNLIIPIHRTNTKKDGIMCFVDGGEGIRELLGAVVYLIKTSGLIIKKTSNRFHDEKFVRDVDMGILDYDEYTKERVELLRSAMEFDVAIKSIEEYNPEYVFIDGSLHVNSKKRSIECNEYSIYRKKFNRLLKRCKENGIHIIGISEDSKSKLFANYLSFKYNIKIPRFMTDSSILRILFGNAKYRTVEFTPCSKTNSSLTVSFTTVYVQPTPFSNPLRIDVPEWDDEFSNIIDLIVELCKGSRHYGYPLPMYLVHLDAKVEKKQAEWSTKQLIHHLLKEEPSLMDSILNKTRRDSRPLG